MILLLAYGKMDTFVLQLLGFFALWLLPPLIMIIAGIAQPDKKREISKMLYIFAAIYFLVGGGMCLSMLGGFG